MFKIWHIGDTHGYHQLLTIPEGIDLIIHSGDFSNYKDVFMNEPEARDFLIWFGNLSIKYKILIAGNHDAYAYSASKQFKEACKYYNIIYLENDYHTIDGIKIFGSPNTPTFGNWYFMKSRDKMDKHWSKVDADVDIFVVHGPPKGIMDLAKKYYGKKEEGRYYGEIMENCGCSALKKHILNRIKPKFCLFGHIHNNDDIVNAGIFKLSAHDTIFSNGSVVTDGKFGQLSSNGNILTL